MDRRHAGRAAGPRGRRGGGRPPAALERAREVKRRWCSSTLPWEITTVTASCRDEARGAQGTDHRDGRAARTGGAAGLCHAVRQGSSRRTQRWTPSSAPFAGLRAGRTFCHRRLPARSSLTLRSSRSAANRRRCRGRPHDRARAAVFDLIADGLSNKEIGERLHLATNTVKGTSTTSWKNWPSIRACKSRRTRGAAVR